MLQTQAHIIRTLTQWMTSQGSTLREDEPFIQKAMALARSLTGMESVLTSAVQSLMERKVSLSPSLPPSIPLPLSLPPCSSISLSLTFLSQEPEVAKPAVAISKESAYQKSLLDRGWRGIPTRDLAEQMCVFDANLFCAIGREDLQMAFLHEKGKANNLVFAACSLSTHTRTHTYDYTHTHKHAHANTPQHTPIHAHTHTHIHIHAHTHNSLVHTTLTHSRSALIRHFNGVLKRTSISLDTEANVADVLRYFIDLAEELMNLRDYNGSV